MKKSDLLMLLEKKFEYLPKREVERTLEKILQFFSSNLSKGNRIEIRDFGSLTTRLRKSRIGRNPKTKKESIITERNVVLFKASKEFKNFINLKNNE